MQPVRKRQKKGDTQGDFKCKVVGCSKGYLSYPALYTHIKSKHGEEFLKEMERPTTQGSRGRPKREDVQIDLKQPTQDQPQLHLNLQIQIESKQAIDDFLLELCDMNCKCVLQGEAEIIKNNQILQAVQQVCEFTGQSIVITLEDILNKAENTLLIIDNLVNVTCDEAFSLFLKELSYTVNLKFLKDVSYFLLSLRAYGNHQDEHYCQTQRPIFFGELINNFIRDEQSKYFNYEKLRQYYNYIDEKQHLLLNEQGDKIIRKIGLHFGNWLFYSRYTTQQLQLS